MRAGEGGAGTKPGQKHGRSVAVTKLEANSANRLGLTGHGWRHPLKGGNAPFNTEQGDVEAATFANGTSASLVGG